MQQKPKLSQTPIDDDCYVEGCKEKPKYQAVLLLFKDCDDCPFPHFDQPAIAVTNRACCQTHKEAATIYSMMPDKKWTVLMNKLAQVGLTQVRRDISAITWLDIPDNIVKFGPKLVQESGAV